MTDALASWRLEDVAQRCAEETQKFRQQRLSDKPVSHNTQFCYEIFRRALADRAVEAWDHIVGLYQRQVEAWILRVPASTAYLDELDAIVNCAFIKFWRACRSKDLAAFPSLESILAYLKTCARSAVHDWAAPADNPGPDAGPAEAPAPDPFLWEMIRSKCKSDKERIVMRDYFLYDLPPRDIFGRNPEIFASAQDVSRTLENVLERLKRDEEMRKYFAPGSR